MKHIWTSMTFFIPLLLLAPEGAAQGLTEAEVEALYGDRSTYATCTQPDGTPLEVYVGQAAVLSAAKEFREISLYARSSVAVQPINVRLIYAWGVQEGRDHLIILGDERNRKYEVLQRCYIDVQPLSALTRQPDKLAALSCRDQNAEPMTLGVGESATLALDEPMSEYAVSDETIISVGSKSNSALMITGTKAGLTTLVVMAGRFKGARVLEECLVTVE